MPTLTVLIPCKNEAHNLRECVASVRGIADEILIADSLSTDDTVALAKSLGCRVIERLIAQDTEERRAVGEVCWKLIDKMGADNAAQG